MPECRAMWPTANSASEPQLNASTRVADCAEARPNQPLLAACVDGWSSALAWRNGLGGLLAGLVGFSLIKGRSDVGQLAAPWNVIVGGVLLLALTVGACGALALLSAAHSRPRLVDRTKLRSGRLGEHEEAVRSQRALQRGIVMVLSCALLLAFAVGTTWYGPAHAPPQLQITTDGEQLCGSAIRVSGDVLILRTALGERDILLRRVTGMRPVNIC